MTTMLMPRQREPGDKPAKPAQPAKPGVPPTGRVLTGEHVPPQWRGIGEPTRQRPPLGRVYGRSRRRRILAGFGWVVLVMSLAISGVAVAAFIALLRILVL